MGVSGRRLYEPGGAAATEGSGGRPKCADRGRIGWRNVWGLFASGSSRGSNSGRQFEAGCSEHVRPTGRADKYASRTAGKATGCGCYKHGFHNASAPVGRVHTDGSR